MRKLITATGLSIILFTILTVTSYFFSIEHRVNFKLGYPWTFYYQFIIDCEVQHGTNVVNLIKDAVFTWFATTLLWLLLVRKG